MQKYVKLLHPAVERSNFSQIPKRKNDHGLQLYQSVWESNYHLQALGLHTNIWFLLSGPFYFI